MDISKPRFTDARGLVSDNEEWLAEHITAQDLQDSYEGCVWWFQHYTAADDEVYAERYRTRIGLLKAKALLLGITFKE